MHTWKAGCDNTTVVRKGSGCVFGNSAANEGGVVAGNPQIGFTDCPEVLLSVTIHSVPPAIVWAKVVSFSGPDWHVGDTVGDTDVVRAVDVRVVETAGRHEQAELILLGTPLQAVT